jgi:hypothetical protein
MSYHYKTEVKLKPLFDWINYYLENLLAKQKSLEKILKKLERLNIWNINGPSKVGRKKLVKSVLPEENKQKIHFDR